MEELHPSSTSLGAGTTPPDLEILAPGEGSALVPSVVSFRPDRVLVGDRAQADRVSNSRNTISPKNEITPAITRAITIMRTSPFRIWVSSWPSTASISRSLSVFCSPRVTVIEYCFSFSPVAKALSALSSAIFSFGMVMPREMHRFSRRL